MAGPGFADHLWFSLLMGFWGGIFALVCALIFRKALEGDITFSQAVMIALPLAFCYLAIWTGGGGITSWLGGGAALGYLTWIAVTNYREERRCEHDLIAADIEKWSRTIAEDDRNSGAHLFLGHALVRKGDYDAAAAEYGRALELDPCNVRGLLSFLAAQKNHQEAEIRTRLPELERIAAEVRRRDTLAAPIAWERGSKVIAPETMASDVAVFGLSACVRGPQVLPGTLGVVEGAGLGEVPEPEKPPAARTLLGYASEEERIAEEELYGRLGELREVVSSNPDDVACRLALAQTLEEVGQLGRAREEYAYALRVQPGHPEAEAALARLNANEPPVAEPAPAEEALPEELAVAEPMPGALPPLVLGDPDLRQGARS